MQTATWNGIQDALIRFILCPESAHYNAQFVLKMKSDSQLEFCFLDKKLDHFPPCSF